MIQGPGVTAVAVIRPAHPAPPSVRCMLVLLRSLILLPQPAQSQSLSLSLSPPSLLPFFEAGFLCSPEAFLEETPTRASWGPEGAPCGPGAPMSSSQGRARLAWLLLRELEVTKGTGWAGNRHLIYRLPQQLPAKSCNNTY